MHPARLHRRQIRIFLQEGAEHANPKAQNNPFTADFKDQTQSAIMIRPIL
jgi:hypothetical protein